jgi:peptidoglycan/xylan/chitin deacetylase (PgdA/CDA1 family)
MMPLPSYYTRLAPFDSAFVSGLPLLTYHKVGRRPLGARLKGLYTSPRLFATQVHELAQSGYRSSSLGVILEGKLSGSRQVVLTFDDGFENVFLNALNPLAKADFTAIEFLVADRLGGVNDWEMDQGERPERLMDAAQVREWLAAGHEIGSHTQTHPFLTRLGRAKAKEEIKASKSKLEDLFGRPIHHFCYPYGDYNQETVDLVAEAGYQTACTTRTGVNQPGTPPLELLRMTVRYRSRSLRSLKEWLFG